MLDPNDIADAVLIAGAFFIIFMVGCAVFNEYLPVWFCHYMQWHVKPKQTTFNGCNEIGMCSRCGQRVMQDSQGNWF
jgi:hypothetical protein